MLPLAFEELQLNQEIAPLENDCITKVQLVKYAGASGDFNPLHTDDEFAKKAGLDGVIAHGMLRMGLISKYVRAIVAENAHIEQVSVRFGKMAKPGDILTCKGKVVELANDGKEKLVTIDVAAINQNGEVITSGTSKVRFY